MIIIFNKKHLKFTLSNTLQKNNKKLNKKL